MPNNKQPSFSARVEQMHDAAVSLKSIAEIVAEEALRMEAAQERFYEPLSQL